jgi:hypothetical protein
MPEGPSVVLLNEALQSFVDKQIINADGASKKVDYGRLPGANLREIKDLSKTSLSASPMLPSISIC